MRQNDLVPYKVERISIRGQYIREIEGYKPGAR